MIGVLVKMIICGMLIRVIVSVITHVKLMNIKNCSWEKWLFGKLALACEDEILNATETSVDDKNVACEKNNFLIHTILMAIICWWYWHLL